MNPLLRAFLLYPSPPPPAHYLYPIRIRVVNDVSGDVRWFTIGYVPIVRALKEPGGKAKATGRRWGVLQRTLYLAFRDAIAASHNGHRLDARIGGYSLAFLRVLLYACDRPEERAVLCMKAGNTGKCCSTCEVQAEDACSEKGVTAAPRDVVETLTRHLVAAKLSRTTRTRKRRVMLETESSINAFVPALASLGGLGTVPHHLYKMIAIDPLHVRYISFYEYRCVCGVAWAVTLHLSTATPILFLLAGTDAFFLFSTSLFVCHRCWTWALPACSATV